MIFGFNTDAACNDTVYHVQSELRVRERLLQTQVFVSGSCVGKIQTPWERNWDETGAQERLREQHGRTVAAARMGDIEALLGGAAQQEDIPALQVDWTNAANPYFEGIVQLRVIVSLDGQGVEGAELSAALAASGGEPSCAQGITDARGAAKLEIPASEEALADCAVVLQASFGSAVSTRRYRLRRNAQA